MSSETNVCGIKRSIPSRLILALLLLIPVYLFPQAGTPPKDTPPPAQSPQPSSGSGKSSGGVSTGVSVDVGQVFHQVFKKKHKVNLEATPAQVQAGQPVTVNASVSPAKPELQYVFQWSQDSPGEQKDAPTAAHTYSSPGQYKVRVVVYEKGKKLAVSDELAITVVPAPPPAVAAGTMAAPVEAKPEPTAVEAKATPPAAEPAVTPAFPEPAPAKAADANQPQETSGSEPQPKVAQPSPAPAKAAARARKNDKSSATVAAAPGKKPVTSADTGVLGATAAPQDSSSSLHVDRHAENGKPRLWAGTWPTAAILLLVLLVGSYVMRRWRKAARGGVIARIDSGRHSINTEGPIAGASLQIRCVPSTIHSTVTIASADNKKEAAHA